MPISASVLCVTPACATAFGDAGLADKLVSAQYHQADNMTDSLAALAAAVAAQLPCRDALMQEYDDKWHRDGLVMDKWFILQSTSPADNATETVRGLLNHRSFSMGNPNRVRSPDRRLCRQQPGGVPRRRR